MTTLCVFLKEENNPTFNFEDFSNLQVDCSQILVILDGHSVSPTLSPQPSVSLISIHYQSNCLCARYLSAPCLFPRSGRACRLAPSASPCAPPPLIRFAALSLTRQKATWGMTGASMDWLTSAAHVPHYSPPVAGGRPAENGSWIIIYKETLCSFSLGLPPPADQLSCFASTSRRRRLGGAETVLGQPVVSRVYGNVIITAMRLCLGNEQLGWCLKQTAARSLIAGARPAVSCSVSAAGRRGGKNKKTS